MTRGAAVQHLSQIDLALHDVVVRAVREALSDPQTLSLLVEALATRAGEQDRPSETPVGRMAYSVKEACKNLSIGRSTLYRAIKSGQLRSIRIGARTVIRAEELESWVSNGPHRDARRQSGEAPGAS